MTLRIRYTGSDEQPDSVTNDCPAIPQGANLLYYSFYCPSPPLKHFLDSQTEALDRAERGNAGGGAYRASSHHELVQAWFLDHPVEGWSDLASRIIGFSIILLFWHDEVSLSSQFSPPAKLASPFQPNIRIFHAVYCTLLGIFIASLAIITIILFARLITYI